MLLFYETLAESVVWITGKLTLSTIHRQSKLQITCKWLHVRRWKCLEAFASGPGNKTNETKWVNVHNHAYSLVPRVYCSGTQIIVWTSAWEGGLWLLQFCGCLRSFLHKFWGRSILSAVKASNSWIRESFLRKIGKIVNSRKFAVTGYFAPQEIWHPHSIFPRKMGTPCSVMC